MIISRHSSLAFFATLILTLATGQAALADDTEVLVGRASNPGPPNIMLMLDTSGSMNSEVVVAEGYDSSIDYCAEFQSCSCNAGRLYFARSTSGTFNLPNCTFDSFVNYDPDPQSAANVFECTAGRAAFDVAGHYQDQFAQFDPTGGMLTWGTLIGAFSGGATPGGSRLVECSSDFGTHGQDGPDTNPAEVYPADGVDGPFTADVALAVDWPSTGDEYTFYTSNFLNYVRSNPEDNISTRMKELKKVSKELVTSIGGINLGLMRFSSDADGGYVIAPVADAASNAAMLTTAIDALDASGNTPLSETMYEAGLYFMGGTVHYGADSMPGTSVESSFAGTGPYDLVNNPPNYKSPLGGECQKSYAVLLTDGLPTNDTGANGLITNLPGFSDVTGFEGCSGNCLDEMSRYLDRADLRTGQGFDGQQSVKTFTIGFHTDQELLENTATGRVVVRDDNGDLVLDGDGEPISRAGYFVANDASQLDSAFRSIIETVQTVGETFSSPAVSINTFNRLTNRNDLFFALFEPGGRGEPHWDGNIKKYRLGSGGGDTLTILDANGNRAVDDAGHFVATAQSFWSATPDGGDISQGGMASRLSNARKVYTDVAGSVLNSVDNRISETNSAVTAAHLAIEDPDGEGPIQLDDVRKDLLKWSRGVNTDGSVRKVVGDPLHSEPLILTYAGGSEDNPNQALVFGTNDGYLHLIDTTPNGRGNPDLETFAYIPSELLPNLKTLRANDPALPNNFQKAYGIDGPISLWIENDHNGVIEAEKAYVYAGMRRGGRNYYALEVSNRDDPQLAWKIRGGTGADNEAFQELGQTWSAAVPGDIAINSTTTQRVLFISGGYDPKQDSPGAPVTDTMGRALYIVNAKTGALIWWAGNPNPAGSATPDLSLAAMTNSIPSSPRVLDINQDGLMDRIYVGDTAGQLWRFDIDNENTGGGAPTITGGVMADIGGDTESDNRRFYYPPSVARIIDDRYGSFLAVSLGSGYRAHPLDSNIDDRFYVFRDINVFTPPVFDVTPPNESDLVDVTNNVAATPAQINNQDGWFLRMNAFGEKVLSSAITADNKIFFSSFIPSAPPLGCSPVTALGSGRLYTVSILNGAPVNYDDPTGPEPEDRYDELDGSGIPPSPVLVFTEPECDDCDNGIPGDDGPGNPPGNATGCNDAFSVVTMIIGTEVVNPNICNAPQQTYWTQEDIDES